MAGRLTRAYWTAFTAWQVRDEERLPYRPLNEIRAIQNRRVHAMVTHAYETVPHYRDAMDVAGLRPHDFHTADDLAQLPIATGAQLAAAPERFLSRRYRGGRSLPIHSSGTTGQSKSIRYDPAALFLALASGHRQRRVLAHFVGRRFGYREMSVVRSAGVPIQLRAFYESHAWTPRRIDLQRRICSPQGSFADDVAQINAFQPDVLIGYGSYIGPLFRWVRTHGAPFHRPKAMLYGADAIAEPDRTLIETEFAVPVLSTYQAVEALRIGFQCEERAAFHVSIDQVAVRLVDQKDRPVGPRSRGEVVLSNLINRATVLLNYKLGDVVTVDNTPCPCGRTLPVISRLDGRSDDVVVLPDGEIRHCLIVLERLRAVPGVLEVQLIQEELQRFVLRVVCAAASSWEQTHQGLDSAMRALCGMQIELQIDRVDAVSVDAGGKVRSVISHCGGGTDAR